MALAAFQAAHTLHKPTFCKPAAYNSYPKDIESFWNDGPLPFIKAPLKLLLHQYDVARIMQPITHSLLQHKQGKHVNSSNRHSIALLDIIDRQKNLIKR